MTLCFFLLLVKAGLELLQPWPCFANRPTRTVHLLNHCMHLRLLSLIFEAYKKRTHHCIFTVSNMRWTINHCIKSFKTTWGHFRICFSVLWAKGTSPFFLLSWGSYSLCSLSDRFTLLWSFYLECNCFKSDVEVALGLNFSSLPLFQALTSVPNIFPAFRSLESLCCCASQTCPPFSSASFLLSLEKTKLTNHVPLFVPVWPWRHSFSLPFPLLLKLGAVLAHHINVEITQ